MKNRIEGLSGSRLAVLAITFLLGSVVAFAQGATAPDLTGTYEGIVKVPDQPEGKVSIELKTEGGKISGRAIHGQRIIELTEAKFENGTLTLKFDKDHMFIAKVDGDKLVGEVTNGTQKIPLELKKVTPAAAAAFNLNGQWDGVADANGQPFPFLLTLKVDGENVTGSSSSQLGDATLKNGTWKDGKLSFEVEGSSGSIAMTATVIDGKLSGDFDFSGQLQGKWSAVRKN